MISKTFGSGGLKTKILKSPPTKLMKKYSIYCLKKIRYCIWIKRGIASQYKVTSVGI